MTLKPDRLAPSTRAIGNPGILGERQFALAILTTQAKILIRVDKNYSDLFNDFSLMATPISQQPDLKPLNFGNIKIDFPIVQAALSGYSDWPMRVIAKRNGAPYTCLLYTSPSPRDQRGSRMPSSA